MRSIFSRTAWNNVNVSGSSLCRHIVRAPALRSKNVAPHRRRRVIFIEPAPENRCQYVGDAQAYVIYVEYKRFCSVKVP